MNVYKIVKNGVTMEINQRADNYGQLSVTARLGNQHAAGTIPGHTGTLYPRIEFRFCPKAQWLHARADSRSWMLDDYETDEQTKNRPTDNCEFVLTSTEVRFLNDWRILSNTPRVETREWKSMDISSGFGIGGRGSDDHDMRFEVDTPITPSEDCKWIHGTRYDESCTRCGRVSAICNDCERCERCHE